MMIRTEAEYQQALTRIEALAGALEDTPESGELIALQFAVEVWEAKREGR